MITVQLLDRRYQLNTDFSWSLAIAMDFDTTGNERTQPNHFNAATASSRPMKAGRFIGDTEMGGSCNVRELKINPHCNGTHTESLAHICDFSAELSLKIDAISPPLLMPCVLVSLAPENALESGDEYTPEFEANDRIISATALQKKLEEFDDEQLQCLVVRTLPNRLAKRKQTYDERHPPAFFSRNATLYLNERGVEHLVLDIPSLDRLHDEGLLTCHHLFWQVAEGSHRAGANSLLNKTITEMAFISDDIPDGFYFMNLQIPAFINDAAPSRPVLFATRLLET